MRLSGELNAELKVNAAQIAGHVMESLRLREAALAKLKVAGMKPNMAEPLLDGLIEARCMELKGEGQ